MPQGSTGKRSRWPTSSRRRPHNRRARKRNRAMNPKEKELVAYHESGHALVAMVLPNTDPVSKISIIPRWIAALGYTQQLPTEDRYLMTRDELLSRLKVLLGGRVSEEIIFGDISTGAQNDLQRATDIARSMVMENGMSEKLGPLTYVNEPRSARLDLGFGSREREFSERTAQQIDEEVYSISKPRTRMPERSLPVSAACSRSWPRSCLKKNPWKVRS